MSPINPREALAREAVRLHERYHREVIERFSICPWAKPARAAGRTRVQVITEKSCEPERLKPVVAGWAADGTIDVAFLIAPRFEDGLEAFEPWAAAFGELLSGVFLTAAFHPNVPTDAGTIRFLRQTPDPTVQLVRRARLEEIRVQDQPHYADIFTLSLSDLQAGEAPRTVAASVFAHNERMVCREGRAALQAIIDDIRADRDETYARILPAI